MADIVQSDYVNTGESPLHFVQGGTPGQPLLVFVHGTGDV